MPVTNLLKNIPPIDNGELFEELLDCDNVRIERIISSPGTRSEVFDQEQEEWILILQGEAKLQVSGEDHQLIEGDSLFIPAHAKHQVLDTSTEPLCIWLAVHIHKHHHSA